MLGLKKILAVGASSLIVFGGVALADEVKVANKSESAEVTTVISANEVTDSAQVKGLIKGKVEFVVPFGSEESKVDNVTTVSSEVLSVKAE